MKVWTNKMRYQSVLLRTTTVLAAMFVVVVSMGQRGIAGPTYNLTRPDMPDHKQSELPDPKNKYYCGPVAAWNSIEWLYKHHPNCFKPGYSPPADWKEGACELGGMMKTDQNKGTWLNDFVAGKQAYFAKYGKEDCWVIKYRDGDWNPVSKSWGNNPPDWNWLKHEFDAGEDIEIILRREGWAHWENDFIAPTKGVGVFDEYPYAGIMLTAQGYTWYDNNGDGDLDDADILYMSFADPHGEMDPPGGGYALLQVRRALSPDYQKNALTLTYGGYTVWITGAVSESCIPAPGAILLASIGVTLVGWLRRRRIV